MAHEHTRATGAIAMLQNSPCESDPNPLQHRSCSNKFARPLMIFWNEKFNQKRVQIDYLQEESPLGTAGALGLIKVPSEAPFLVSNCDIITDISYGALLDFHVRNAAAATMAVRMHEWRHPYGVVRTQGIEIVGFEEKPVSRTQINAGIYALNPASLQVLSAGTNCDMPTLFDRLLAKAQRAVAYPMHEPWSDVGRPDDLKLIEM